MRKLLIVVFIASFGLVENQSFAAEEDLGARYARETATLNSLKLGLEQQVSQLRKAHEAKMTSKNAQLESLESKLAQVTVEVDETQARFDDAEKKSKSLSAGGGLEAATKDLRKTLEAYEARPRKTASSIDPMRAYQDEVFEAAKFLRRASQIREEAGAFKMKDGTVTQGALKWFGETSVIGKTERGRVPLGPDGTGGWLAIDSSMAKGPMAKSAIFSDLRTKIDISVAATSADRLAGFIPIFWLALLGLAVSWLFVSIAKQ
jgi:hypothetical protein